MICFKINCGDNGSMAKLRDKFNYALMGSPAYIESEIAVCNCEEDDSCFFLVVGDSNDYNLDLEIKSGDIVDLDIKEK